MANKTIEKFQSSTKHHILANTIFTVACVEDFHSLPSAELISHLCVTSRTTYESVAKWVKMSWWVNCRCCCCCCFCLPQLNGWYVRSFRCCCFAFTITKGDKSGFVSVWMVEKPRVRSTFHWKWWIQLSVYVQVFPPFVFAWLIAVRENVMVWIVVTKCISFTLPSRAPIHTHTHPPSHSSQPTTKRLKLANNMSVVTTAIFTRPKKS